MAANVQMSQEKATQNGIHALESAQSGIQKCRADVDHTRGGLAPGYGGPDGKAFQDLLTQWDGQCEVITKNLKDMIQALEHTLQGQRKTQSGVMDGISHESGKAHSAGSDHAYNALAG